MGRTVEFAVRAVVGARDLVARLPQVVGLTRGLGFGRVDLTKVGDVGRDSVSGPADRCHVLGHSA
jgi:hypothetical protein